jgi:hypothetical protein
MRFMILAFAAATLVSCAKPAKERVSRFSGIRAEQELAAAADALANTGAHKTETLLAAAATLAKAQRGLGEDSFLRCWKGEGKRPQVREACLLAASMSNTAPTNQAASELHGILQDTPSRNEALAILRWTGAVELLGEGELKTLLAALSEDPPWTRAHAIHRWIANKNTFNAWLVLSLWKSINLPHEAPDPYSLGESYRVAIKFGNKEDFHSNYCPGWALEPYAMIRCYRFLTTLVDPRTGTGLPDWLKIYLPHDFENETKYFRDSYPARARLLQPIP